MAWEALGAVSLCICGKLRKLLSGSRVSSETVSRFYCPSSSIGASSRLQLMTSKHFLGLLVGCIFYACIDAFHLKASRGQFRGLNLRMAEKDSFQLVLVRHGESTWNEENKFTGWYDCPLSVKGQKEAQEAGKLLRDNGFVFDIAYTSMLQRAIRTLWHTLEQTELMYIPIVNAWELNERHYGALQGLNKKETVDKYGTEQVNVWRRSYDTPPPDCDTSSLHYPGNDPKYASHPVASKIRAESLKTTLDRVLPYWEQTIAPTLQSGKRVVIAAHGNSLRALVKHLDNIAPETIAELNIPTGVPLVYDLDKNLKPIRHPDAIAPLSGRYLGDQEAIRAKIEGVKNQTKK